MSVREHRTAVDWAEEIKYLVDTMYPDAEKIVLVMDNLNTHKPASLYKRYPPEEARRITKKLEIHYTSVFRSLPGIIGKGSLASPKSWYGFSSMHTTGCFSS